METIIIEKTKIDMKTGKQTNYTAELQRKHDANHPIYTLTYGGYQSEWKEVSL